MATIIIWDDDGVISDWTTGFNLYMGWEGFEWQSFSAFRDKGVTKEEFAAHLDHFSTTGHFADLRFIDGALETFKAFEALGYLQILVTSKPNDRGFLDATRRLARKGFNFYESVQVEGHNKVPAILEFVNEGDLVFALDDRIENVQSMRDVGIDAMLYTQPWNRSSELPRFDTHSSFALYTESIVSAYHQVRRWRTGSDIDGGVE
jgi:hypothetical protein